MGGGTRLIASSIIYLYRIFLEWEGLCFFLWGMHINQTVSLDPKLSSRQHVCLDYSLSICDVHTAICFFSSIVAKVVSTTFSFWRMGLRFTPKYSQTKHVSQHKIKYFHCYSDYCYLFSCASASHHKEAVAFKIC